MNTAEKISNWYIQYRKENNLSEDTYILSHDLLIWLANKEPNMEWLMDKYEKSSNRYIESEQLLSDITQMNIFQRIFCKSMIYDFLNKQLKRYNF